MASVFLLMEVSYGGKRHHFSVNGVRFGIMNSELSLWWVRGRGSSVDFYTGSCFLCLVDVH